MGTDIQLHLLKLEADPNIVNKNLADDDVGKRNYKNLWISTSYHFIIIFPQFLFIEGADIPDLGSRPVKIKESLRTLSPHGHTTTTTKTTFKQNGKCES